MSRKISIVIPAFNEEDRIERSLHKAFEFFADKEFDYEIIVVNDGSSDNTANVLEKYSDRVIGLNFKSNRGKGFGVREGMLKANGDVRIFTDADFSTPIYEVDRVLAEIDKGADICIGSRAVDRSMIKERQPFYRESMGKIFNLFVQALVFSGISDTQCGFKAFRANAAEKIFSQTKIDGFSFDVEVLYLAKKFGLVVSEIPVEWYNDQRSTVNPIKDSLMMLIELFKIRKLHR